MTLKFLSFLYLISIFICNKKDATIIQEKNSDVTFEWVVNDVEIPWGMAFLPDGSFLYTEKRGIIFYYKDGKKTEVGRPPDVYNRGQGGLLDICLHPKFSENNFIRLVFPY
jgi:quinoprotein glucose dehydrogenase